MKMLAGHLIFSTNPKFNRKILLTVKGGNQSDANFWVGQHKNSCITLYHPHVCKYKAVASI